MERVCAQCGCDISNLHARREVCSTRCSNRRERLRQRDAEHARRQALFERDGWRCAICGGPVRRDGDPQSDPDAPTLDHIIPRVDGGGDEPGNLQTAHRKCNNAKGATVLWWQV